LHDFQGVLTGVPTYSGRGGPLLAPAPEEDGGRAG
jgi:hypothetical protein